MIGNLNCLDLKSLKTDAKCVKEDMTIKTKQKRKRYTSTYSIVIGFLAKTCKSGFRRIKRMVCRSFAGFVKDKVKTL